MYYVRRRQTPDDPVLLEHPIDIEMNVTNRVLVDDHDVEVYVSVVADWVNRVIDVEVEQFVADRASYESALEDSLANDLENLFKPDVGDYEYDYYYYDTYTAPYANNYDELDIADPVADGAFDALPPRRPV
jgi:hypothetical protein